MKSSCARKIESLLIIDTFIISLQVYLLKKKSIAIMAELVCHLFANF